MSWMGKMSWKLFFYILGRIWSLGKLFAQSSLGEIPEILDPYVGFSSNFPQTLSLPTVFSSQRAKNEKFSHIHYIIQKKPFNLKLFWLVKVVPQYMIFSKSPLNRKSYLLCKFLSSIPMFLLSFRFLEGKRKYSCGRKNQKIQNGKLNYELRKLFSAYFIFLFLNSFFRYFEF